MKRIFSILFALVLAVSLMLVPAVVSANPGTIQVDVNDAACVTGPQLDPYSVVYCSIQDAIDDATADDTIIVADGTYNENIVVNKSLTLQAASSSTIIGSGGYMKHVTKVTANDVTISGFTVKSDGYCAAAGGIYLDTGVEGCNITGNNVSEIRLGYGIYLKSANNNTITSNVVTKGAIPDWATLAGGIYLDGSSGNTIANNTASGTKSGIYLKYSNGNELTDNEASSNKNGIYLERSNSNTVTGNTVSENYHGFYIKVSSINTFMSNEASNNNYGFYQLGTPNANEIKNNSVTLNTYWGIYLHNGEETEIEGNTISSNGDPSTGPGSLYGGIWISQYTDASTVSVNCNNIVGNYWYGVYNNNANLLDAENNWWGHASGPLHPTTNPLGQGNAVSDYVDYSQWAYIPDFCEAKTMGYWKTHPDLVDGILDVETVELAGLTVTPTWAQEIFASAKSKNYYMLAAQLLAAKLNVLHLTHFNPGYDSSCVDDAIVEADALLTGVTDFSSRLPKSDRATVNELKDILDAFNNNGCPDNVCPCAFD